jgi:hypothetical protein
MSSTALIDNRLFNKLIANKLVAQEIKTDETFPLTPQYLFSVLFNSNAKFERISDTTGHLIFSIADITSSTKFTDRPLRKTFDISAEEFLSYFTTTVGSDTFRDDPPNAVLVHSEEQRVYTVTNLTNDGSEYRFEMTTLPDETHTSMSTVSGPFSLFVDTGTGDDGTNSYYPQLMYDNENSTLFYYSSQNEKGTLIPTVSTSSMYTLTIYTGTNYTISLHFNNEDIDLLSTKSILLIKNQIPIQYTESTSTSASTSASTKIYKNYNNTIEATLSVAAM